MVGGRAVMEAPPPMEEEVEYIYSHMEYIIQGVPKKRTFRMLLEPSPSPSPQVVSMVKSSYGAKF